MTFDYEKPQVVNVGEVVDIVVSKTYSDGLIDGFEQGLKCASCNNLGLETCPIVNHGANKCPFIGEKHNIPFYIHMLLKVNGELKE